MGMKIDGFVRIEAVDTESGVVLETRDVKNMVFDAFRMKLFFPSGTSSSGYQLSGQKLRFQNTQLYLSTYTNPITQSSYSAIPGTIYAKSATISPSASWPGDNVNYPGGNTVLYTFATQSFGGSSPTRNISCVGIVESTYPGNDVYSAVSIYPYISHNSSTTIFLHYMVQVTMDAGDNLFGYETFYRYGYSTYVYFGYYYSQYGYTPSEQEPFTVAMPGYKKYYYISQLNRKIAEVNSTPYPYPDNTNATFLFKYTDNEDYFIKKGTITIPNQGDRSWCGPYGGIYEMRNSGLGAGCIYDPHISRVFAHMSSASSKIFYDSSEADVPESAGTLTTDVTNTTLKYPSAFKMLFTEGDVTVATYSLQEWVLPHQNSFAYSHGFFGLHMYGNDSSGYNPPYDSSYNYIKQIYVSGNRDWRCYRLANTQFESYPYQYSESQYFRTYMYIGYKNLERPYSSINTCKSYCIDNNGIFYFTKNKGATVWSNPTAYAVGDTVYFNGNDWLCNTAHTSSTSIYPGVSGTYSTYWTAFNTSTIVYTADMDADTWNPTVNTLIDIAAALPGKGITQIRGLCIDEDMGYLWIATDVGFARCNLSTSEIDFFDHNTVGFGVYMTGVANVVLYSQWNGRFVAERGTLTWVQSSAANTVWHWTGDRDARKCAVSSTVANLFVDYDRGLIGVMSNYIPVILRIGNAAQGVVITYTSPQQAGDPYSCGMEGGNFWVCNMNYTYTAPGTNGLAMKFRIDLDNLSSSALHIMATNYQLQEQYSSLGYTNTFSTAYGNVSANKSIVEGVMTMCLSESGSLLVLATDCGPIFWGWNGSQWVMNSNVAKTTHFDQEYIPRNILVGFNDGGVADSFINGDYYSFGVNPQGLYVDNLQTVTVNIDMYGWHAEVQTCTVTVPAGGTYTIAEASYPNFVNMVAWSGDPHVRVKFQDGSLGLIKNVLGVWATATAYAVGNIVTYNSINYRCLLAHTSSAGNAPGTSGGASIWTTVIAATTLDVLFEYSGRITFSTSRVNENVEVRYAWQSKVI
jgi:chitodextrinase